LTQYSHYLLRYRYLRNLEENQKSVDDHVSAGKFGKEAAFKRQRQNLLAKSEEVERERQAAEKRASEAGVLLQSLESKKQELDGASSALLLRRGELTEEEEKSSQKAELSKLKELVLLNENLRAQETSFKAGCKAQLQDMHSRIAAFESGDDDPDSEENKKLSSVEDMHSKVMSKYNSLRSLLAETNLEVSNSARVIDDIPTRSELIQYERRFVELYQQVAWKLEETRKYYAMYNTLDSNLTFLQKNVKILNSITETFDQVRILFYSCPSFFSFVPHDTSLTIPLPPPLKQSINQSINQSSIHTILALLIVTI
jgi:small-conductance mechanosensitive channel